MALRGQLKELNAQLREREEAMLGLKDSYSTKSRELEKCEGELRRTLSEVAFEQHFSLWLWAVLLSSGSQKKVLNIYHRALSFESSH